MAVIDASVLVAAAVDAGAAGTWAEEVLRAGDIAAPHLVLVEAGNILRRLKGAGHIDQLEATSAFHDLMRLDIDLFPFAPFADRVWELRANVTCYDAWYVAVAEALDLPLATLDEKLVRAPGPTCRFVTS
jgi:predicted nucleic acid-binding protein